MSYNRSFMITRKVTKLVEADVATVSKKTRNIDQLFRARKVVEDGVTKYLLDFGPGAPRIEMVVDGECINASFITTEEEELSMSQ